MQLLELSHMLDGATTPHLLLPGVAIPGRDCQDEGDDGCLRALSAYARVRIPPFPSCSGWLECSKMHLCRWNFWAVSPWLEPSLLLWLCLRGGFRAGGLILLLKLFLFFSSGALLIWFPFPPFEFASRD